jgi:hypothetical protein
MRKYIVYLNIGELPSKEANFYARGIMMECKKFFGPDSRILWIPVRDRDTFVQPLSNEDIDLSLLTPEDHEFFAKIDAWLNQDLTNS